MKRIILSLILGVAGMMSLNAQNFTTDSIYKVKIITEDKYQDFYLTVPISNTGDDADYTWTNTEMVMPSDWRTAVCDPFLCHDTSVNSAQYILDSGASSFMIMHFYMPSTSGGFGCTRLIVEDDNSGEKDTMVYCLQIYNEHLNVSFMKSDEIKIYPNPASDYIQLVSAGSIKEVQLTDLNGKMLKTAKLDNTHDIRIQTNDLPTGLYLVRVKNSGGQISTTKVTVSK